MKGQTILIVDDAEMNRSILADMLDGEYEIREAADGVQAVAQLKRLGADLVLLDIMMPRMDGFGVLEVMNRNSWIRDTPVIMVSAENDAAQVERAYELGASDFIMRPFDALIVRRRVVNTLLLYAKQRRLAAFAEEQLYEKEQRSRLMIDILSHIVEFRNGESGLHILHVRTLTRLLLEELIRRTDRYHLTREDVERISLASALHDIGKIAIPEHILNKPGRLTAEEFAVMKTHSAVGGEMLDALPLQHQGESLVKTAREICRWHHERYDGRGYPDGLRGEDIPIAAQVVALADVYDALTSERVYKPPFPHEQAIRMITGGECGAFQPLLLTCLEQCAQNLRSRVRELQGREQMPRSAEEILRSEGGGLSSRTLRLLDYERMKYRFFAAMTEEIQFEYTLSPPMLILSPWGASRFGLEENILNPLENPALREILGEEGLRYLRRLQMEADPDYPDASQELLFRVDAEERWYRILTRTVWSADDPPRYLGILGKALDIHREKMRLTELEKKASTDPLTGLLNRSGVRDRVSRRLRQTDRRCAMACIDLDYLKRANDLRGHAFGDRVLVELARRLQGSIRGSDLAARVGGDEFLLFLEYEDGLERIMERIFRTLCGPMDAFSITVSMGVAEGRPEDSYETLFQVADQALYEAKRAGRARFCLAKREKEKMKGARTI